MTTQKHCQFLSGPMGDYPVTVLPGIGPVLGVRLAAQGFDMANLVYAQYLMQRKNEELFILWLKGITGANNKQAGDCYYALNAWHVNFFAVM